LRGSILLAGDRIWAPPDNVLIEKAAKLTRGQECRRRADDHLPASELCRRPLL